MQSSTRKALIKTLPLSNGNYGGILQSYALQKVLRSLDYAPYTDTSRSDISFQGLKNLIKALAVKTSSVAAKKPKWVRDGIERELNIRMLEFCRQHIATVRIFNTFGRPDMGLVNSFDAMVVGSDQVWRTMYGDVRSYLFDFAKESRIPKIAYAASFGVTSIDEEYGEALIAETAALAKLLDAVGVREESGVTICAEKWGIPAIQVVDPTMLLDAHHYAELAAHSEMETTGGLLTYILDTGPKVERWVTEIGNAIGHAPRKLMPDMPNTLGELRANPEAFIRPSVYAWLQAIQQADDVITDSFHGTVFAILFEKPFLVIKNKERGSARFDTLLGIFGLQDRAAEVGEDAAAKMLAPIDWEQVRRLLALKRQTARDFLTGALSRSGQSSIA